MSKKNVVLTGATGFVGEHLLKELIKNNYFVIGVTRENKDGVSPKEMPCCSWVRPSELRNLIVEKKIYAAIHMATNYGRRGELEKIIADNVLFPLEVFSRCAEIGCSLFLTTDTFFGKPIFDYQHMGPYIQSKNDLVGWLKIFNGIYADASVFNLRLEHVYGMGDRAGKFIPDLIRDLENNKKTIPMTSGEQMRDFVNVEDVVSAYMKILTVGENNPRGLSEYEIGTGTAVSIKFLACTLRELIGSKSQFNFGALPQRKGEIMVSKCSSAFSDDFKWQHNISLETGLRKLLKRNKPVILSG